MFQLYIRLCLTRVSVLLGGGNYEEGSHYYPLKGVPSVFLSGWRLIHSHCMQSDLLVMQKNMYVFVTGVKLSLVILQLCDKEDCEKYVIITLDDTLRCDDDAFFWQRDARILSLEIPFLFHFPSPTSTPFNNHILIGFENNLSTIVDVKHGDRRQFCRHAACFGHR